MHEQGGNGGKGATPLLFSKSGVSTIRYLGERRKSKVQGDLSQRCKKKRKKERKKNKLAHNICLPTFGSSLGHRQTRDIACHAGWCRWPIVILLHIVGDNDIWRIY